MTTPPPEPFYTTAELRPAYELRYVWTGWSSGQPFPADLGAVLSGIAPEWEQDGIRLLETSLNPQRLLLTFSARPQLAPVTLAARVKGRLQHHCRLAGRPVTFSRKVAVRSIGHNVGEAVENYIARQAVKEPLADERFRALLQRLCVNRSEVDLSRPTETRSGRYWYNLHLVLVLAERYRVGDEEFLTRLRDTALRIADKKGYGVATLAVMPDHLHVALRGNLEQSPEETALAYLNNLAYALGRRRWWEAGYYAGTFSE
jgi:REP element-mobilizing transposase RayT